MEFLLKGFTTLVVYIIILFAAYGLSICIGDEIVSPVQYIENGIKIDAVEYQDNIYLKKGEPTWE